MSSIYFEVTSAFRQQSNEFKNEVYGQVWHLAGSPQNGDSEWGRTHANENRDRLEQAVAIVAHRRFDLLDEEAKNQIAGRIWHLAERPQNVEMDWGKIHAKDANRVHHLLTAMQEIEHPIDTRTYRLIHKDATPSNVKQSESQQLSYLARLCRCISNLFSCLFAKKSPFIDKTKLTIAALEHRLNKSGTAIQKSLEKEMGRCRLQMDEEHNGRFQYLEAPHYWETRTDVSAIASHPHRIQVGGLDVGYIHAQGRRLNMEDEHIAVQFNLNIQGKTYPIQLFGVMDGHGGGEASKYVRDHLQQKLQSNLLKMNAKGLTDEGIWKALKITFVELHDDFIKSTTFKSGTTATVAMILDGNLWTANVGDSRTVLDNNGIPEQLSDDAKPNDPRYAKGIENRRGYVERKRVNGELGVARAIGDRDLKGANSARPKITKKPISEIQPNSHLILCCDGIYDVASTKQIVKGVHDHSGFSPEKLAKDIIYSAYEASSGDNLTAVVVKLK